MRHINDFLWRNINIASLQSVSFRFSKLLPPAALAIPDLAGDLALTGNGTMAESSEHKTVQAHILQYAQEIGWTHVPFAEAKTRRGFDPDRTMPEGGMRHPLMTAQTLVHDLDLEAILAQAVPGILSRPVPEFGNKLWPNSPKVFGAFERLRKTNSH